VGILLETRRMINKRKISFFSKDDQSYRPVYADVLLQLATDSCDETFARQMKLLKKCRITPWVDLLTSFCFVAGIRMAVVKRWLNKDNSKQAEPDFIKAYEEAKSFIEARLASGLLDNYYKRDVVETVMWWKFRERVSPSKEIEQKPLCAQLSFGNAGFFSLEKNMKGEQ
jgi:hypothetical protein